MKTMEHNNHEKSRNGKTKKTGKKKVILRVLVILLSGILVLMALNYGTIRHAYYGINLFNTSKLSDSFRNLDQRFPVRKVEAGENVYRLEEDLRDLPGEYLYSEELRSIRDFIDRTGTTGLLVAQGNRILFEEYAEGYEESDRMITWSVSKSVISALMGIAVEEGAIRDIEDLVTDYVPSLSNSGYRDVSIKDALQMSSGVGFNEDYFDRNSDVNRMGARAIGLGGSLEDVLLSLESERQPGAYNRYVSGDAQVLGMVLREATGMGIAEYTEEKLWKPAGMEFDAYWLTDSTGVEAAFGGFNASLRDLARFGMLYLNGGLSNDRQVLPKHWIEESLKPDGPQPVPGEHDYSHDVLGYGYQWWIPEGTEGEFLAMGIYGQAIYLNSERDIVIVKTSAYRDYEEDGEKMELESIEFFRGIANGFE